MSEKPPLRVEDIPVTNLTVYLLDNIRNTGDRVAMVDCTTETTITYSELIARIERAASGLQALGVRKDDVIGVLTPNHPDYLVTFYTCALIGATLQPINPLFTKDDLAKVIRQCSTKYLFTVTDLLPKVEEATQGYDNIKVLVYGEAKGYTTFESLLHPHQAPYQAPEMDPKTSIAALLSSSGTTGFPKAVCVSHYAIVTNFVQQNWFGLSSADETFVTFLPFFNILGLSLVAYTGHCLGSRLVIMSRFDFETYLKLIETYKPKTLTMVPPIMVLFAKSPKVSEYDLSSVTQISCGAAPLSKEIEDVVKERLKLPCIYQGISSKIKLMKTTHK
ncbi:probable 4-coumarate--CoA ligase 1 [Mya arenaria]|uniref:probable 4-coumarate--CoA ligase 1 n=1 Tax=Mya arenaria TaxID=6604 RepID=UPI0022E01F1D|nr:probable 4-coumarate--CoA ligase 1 [Mya arenaria]